jgi:hypothetical protein
LYDEEGNLMFPKADSVVSPIDYLGRTNVMCIIQCGGVWFAGGKFGVTWKLLQAVVQKPRDTIQGKCMIVVNAENKAKFASAPQQASADAEEETLNVVDDSDNEAEPPVVVEAVVVEEKQPEVVASEPVAVVPVEKKVVRRVVKKSTA